MSRFTQVKIAARFFLGFIPGPVLPTFDSWDQSTTWEQATFEWGDGALTPAWETATETWEQATYTWGLGTASPIWANITDTWDNATDTWG